MTVVVDASVACKWFFEEEEQTGEADRILADEELIAPELIYLEVVNVLWKHIRRGSVSSTRADEILSQLLTIPIQLADARVLLPAALEIATKHGRTVYDSMYVALAIARDCEFITADERLVN